MIAARYHIRYATQPCHGARFLARSELMSSRARAPMLLPPRFEWPRLSLSLQTNFNVGRGGTSQGLKEISCKMMTIPESPPAPLLFCRF